VRKLTLSKVGLAGSCLYSFRDDVQAPPQETNIFAQNGTVFGEAVANAVCGLPVPEMNETTQSFYDQWSLHYTLEDFGVCLPEIALALDVVTSEVKFLGVNIGRGYAASGAGPDDICGSIDLAGVKDGRLYVWEWKSGVQYHLTRYNNPQCRSYGAPALLRVPGRLHITWQDDQTMRLVFANTSKRCWTLATAWSILSLELRR